MIKVFLSIASTLFLTGCGYHMGSGSFLEGQYQTISVPFVSGDKTGELTEALVRQISQDTTLSYTSGSSDLELIVKIIKFEKENIGFQYDRSSSKKYRHSVIPTETRMRVIAEVELYDKCKGCTALGPLEVRVNVDFDHDYYYSPNQVNAFSLGQLTDIDEAYDAVLKPLYQALAFEIMMMIKNY